MRFQDLPDWLIAGPVVFDKGKPLFERHQIHLTMCMYYRDIDDVLYIESIVRKFVDDYEKDKEGTIAVLRDMMIKAPYKRS